MVSRPVAVLVSKRRRQFFGGGEAINVFAHFEFVLARFELVLTRLSSFCLLSALLLFRLLQMVQVDVQRLVWTASSPLGISLQRSLISLLGPTSFSAGCGCCYMPLGV